MFGASLQTRIFPTIAHSLSRGMAGLGTVRNTSPSTEIKDVQRMLNAFGANPRLTEDGRFGDRTLDAVQAFQRLIGKEYVSGDYRVDDGTLNALGLPQYTEPWRNLPSGGGNTGGGNSTGGGGNSSARIRFEWVAPAIVNATALTTWTTAQNTFGTALSSNGFTVEYNSYQFNSVLGAAWSLVVRGISPANVTDKDTLNNTLINIAEQSGFNIDVGDERLTLGSRVGGTPGENVNDDRGNSNTAVKLGGAGLLIILAAAAFILKR